MRYFLFNCRFKFNPEEKQKLPQNFNSNSFLNQRNLTISLEQFYFPTFETNFELHDPSFEHPVCNRLLRGNGEARSCRSIQVNNTRYQRWGEGREKQATTSSRCSLLLRLPTWSRRSTLAEARRKRRACAAAAVCGSRNRSYLWSVARGEARPWGLLSDALISLFAPDRVIPS